MDGFHVTELGKALAEQHFGIVTSRLDGSPPSSSSAFAVITLLEQREIRIKLSNRGYEIVDGTNLASENTQAPVFETLDDLLLATSPKYGERRAEEFMARLSQLAETPS